MKKKIIYVSVFANGAAVLILEILGTRIVAPFYGATIFVWTSSIIVTLGALAAGYYIGGRLVDRDPTSKLFSGILFLAGLAFLIPMKIYQWVLPATNGLGIQYGPLISIMMLFGLPLFLSGMLSPVSIRLLSKNIKSTGSVAGQVFALSTLGSIIGGLLSGFYLITVVPISVFLNVIGLILMLLSLVMVFSEGRDNKMLILLMTTVAGVSLFPGYKYKDEYTTQILHQEQGYYGDLKVISVSNLICVMIDNLNQSCRSANLSEDFNNYFKEVAAIINSNNPKSVLVLGSGGGELVAAGLNSTGKVDLVDIDPGVIRLSADYLKFTPSTGQTQYIDDARHFLITHKDNKYDAVFMDLAKGLQTPYYLYSKESLNLVSDELNNNGTFLLHILGGIGENDRSTASIIKTLKTVFPSVEIFTTKPGENVDYIVVAAKDPGFHLSYKSKFGVKFIPAKLNMDRSIVLSDDFNPLDIYFSDKSEVLIKDIRNFSGLRTVLTL